MTSVAIDARVPRESTGGIAHVLTGLAQGFVAAQPAELNRTWLVFADYERWLGPYIPPGDAIVVVSSSIERLGLRISRRFPKTVSRLRPHVERVLAARRDMYPLDALLAERGIDVVHLPFQDGIRTKLPTIYHPHDLQHLHLPQNFTPAQRRHRETAWRGLAERSYAVCVGTRWVADDVIRSWKIDAGRVHVVPLAPVRLGDASENRGVGSEESGRPLILYPAAFWPHKNHAQLVRAAAILKGRGVPFRLVMPGSPIGTFSATRKLAFELGLDIDEAFPGFVTDAQLGELYSAARVIAVPSLFESASFPVWEAFDRGVPAVVVETTSLPSQVADGGLVVPQHDAQAMADSLERLLTDRDLWNQMSSAARIRVAQFTWKNTSNAITALYRRAAGEAAMPHEEAALTTGPRL